MSSAGFLTGKVILIITPQFWGNMLLAKHHYAIGLAKKGNEVYFLNPPDNQLWSWKPKRIWIEAISDHKSLFVIHQQLYFPYKLKFHSRKIYNLLVKKQIRNIFDAIPKPVDLIWSFDLGNLFPLSFFDRKILKVFQPVDEPGDKIAISAASGADILFSVTKEILEKYKIFDIPSYFINHGLADEFLTAESNHDEHHKQINVGFSGNMLRDDLDRKTLLQILQENAEVLFHFYGSYTVNHSNIGGSEDRKTVAFIEKLQTFRNVKLQGVYKTIDLAHALNQMDALLICYDLKLDQSKGTNYHKVMEYLSTGKVIISNNITTFREYPDLIRMVSSRENNDLLPSLFRETIADLKYWNSEKLVNLRRSFAQNNTYHKQLERIESHISKLAKSKAG